MRSDSQFPLLNSHDKHSPTIYNASELSKERQYKKAIRLGGKKAAIRALQNVETIQNSWHGSRSPQVRSNVKKKSPSEYTYRNHNSMASKQRSAEMPNVKLVKRRKLPRNPSPTSGTGTMGTNYIHSIGKTTMPKSIRSPKRSVPVSLPLLSPKSPLRQGNGKLPEIKENFRQPKGFNLHFNSNMASPEAVNGRFKRYKKRLRKNPNRVPERVSDYVRGWGGGLHFDAGASTMSSHSPRSGSRYQKLPSTFLSPSTSPRSSRHRFSIRKRRPLIQHNKNPYWIPGGNPNGAFQKKMGGVPSVEKSWGSSLGMSMGNFHRKFSHQPRQYS